jgi:tetratricopeptide (TPR) repeat protein
MSNKLFVLSGDLIKWNVDRLNVGVSFNVYYNNESNPVTAEFVLNNPAEATNTTFLEIIKQIAEKYAISPSDLELRDEETIRKAMLTLYEKWHHELLSSKNPKTKSKQTITRYNLFYLKEPEILSLSTEEKLLAYTDIIERKAAKEQYNQIGTYIKEALDLRPGDLRMLRHLSRYYMAVNKETEAIETLEKYVELKPTDVQAVTELARLCDKVKDFKRADSVYDKIIDNDPENLDALVRRAQIKFYKREKFESELDTIKKIDPTWLKEFLKKNWDYHLPDAKKDLNPIKLAYYLGFNKAMDILNFAFNKEIPAYIDERDARVQFSKEEIDLWYVLISKYDINEYSFRLYPEAI